jgi:hypothetical protein
MWKYFQELKAMAVWGVSINEQECAKRLIPISKHWASAIYDTAWFQGVPYIGVFTCAPYQSVKHFPMCEIPMAVTNVPYGYHEGFMWLRMDDFIQLFDAVWECRLINSDLRSLAAVTQQREVVPRQFPGGGGGGGNQEVQSSMYERFTPAYASDRSPWYEKVWAYRGEVTTENCPTFLIQVQEPGVELVMDVSTTDHRYDRHAELPETSRHMQAPLLLRFFQCARDIDFRQPELNNPNGYMELLGAHSGEIYMVHMSAWGHNRDAMCCVKVLRPGNFVALVSMPGSYACKKMIFRTYSSRPSVKVSYLQAHKQLLAVNPGMPLCAIPYSLTGMPRIDEYSERLPRMFDEDEGKGKNLQPMWQQGAQKRIEKALGMKDGSDGPGVKVIGKFGGANAEASTMAAEDQGQDCSVM